MTENDIPQISIFGSSHRPQYWMDLYNSIGDNDVTFEIIFVGPKEPDYKLPDNFRFIKSLVKPTQCLEIAARNTKADLIMNIADDFIFRTERPLDKLCETYKSYNNDKLILSCRYMHCGQDHSHTGHPEYGCHLFYAEDYESPVMPIAGLISRKLYMDIGGIDTNFITCYYDLDMAMRVYAIGGCVKLSEVYVDEPYGAGGEGYIYRDRQYLDSLWVTNGKIHFNRTRPVESFSDDRILEISQGRKGKWI